MTPGAGGAMLGFPPGRHFVLLPEAPRRAALEGLALYDAVAVRQVAFLAAGRLLVRSGLGRVMRLRRPAPLPDAAWWRSWLTEAVVPRVGPIGGAAFRLLGDGPEEPDRFTCLLLDPAGAPLAFGKVWRGGDGGPGGPDVIAAVAGGGTAFRVPGRIGAGRHAGRAYLLQAPLPSGGHRRMRPDPARLRAVVAELRERLRPALEPPPQLGLVPVHGSLTPLNLRRDRGNGLWLLDWDKAGWGPPRYDEVRYWIADLARRGQGPAPRRAARALRLLGVAADDAGLRDALRWRRRVRPREVLPAEQEIRDALTTLAAVR